MRDETVTLFFALCALALGGVTIVVAIAALVDRGDRLGIVAQARAVALPAAAVVATACTAGSLYLSEVIGYVPCRLCWVQRGFMYPAALLLVAALTTRRRALGSIAGVLAAFGLAVAVFHRVEQAVGEIGGVCDAVNPCSGVWVEHFGFVTIPTMAAIGFLAILLFTLLARSGRPDDRPLPTDGAHALASSSRREQ